MFLRQKERGESLKFQTVFFFLSDIFSHSERKILFSYLVFSHLRFWGALENIRADPIDIICSVYYIGWQKKDMRSRSMMIIANYSLLGNIQRN